MQVRDDYKPTCIEHGIYIGKQFPKDYYTLCPGGGVQKHGAVTIHVILNEEVM